MAHIDKRIRKNGQSSWRVQIRNKGVPAINRTFRTEEEATDFSEKYVYEHDGKRYISIPFSYLINKHYVHFLNESCDKKTRTCFNAFWTHELGGELAQYINPKRILYSLARLKEKNTKLGTKLSDETVRKYLSYLSSVFTFGVIKGLVPKNPVKNMGFSFLKPRKDPTPKGHYNLKNEFINKLLLNVNGDELRKICGLPKESLRVFMHPTRNTSFSQMEKVLSACGLEWHLSINKKTTR